MYFKTLFGGKQHDIDRDSTTEEDNKRFLRSQVDGRGGGDPEDCRRGRRMKHFLEDYKTWGYMTCVGLVVVGAIVIIILAASGVISTSRES